MSVLNKKLVEPKRLFRWVTILDADESLEIPELKFDLGMINDSRFASLTKPYERKGTIQMTPSEQKKFREAVLVDCVRDWSGMCKKNAMRLCSVYAENPEMLEDAPEDNWPFDRDDLGNIGHNMAGVIFGSKIIDEAIDLDAYAKESIRNK